MRDADAVVEGPQGEDDKIEEGGVPRGEESLGTWGADDRDTAIAHGHERGIGVPLVLQRGW